MDIQPDFNSVDDGGHPPTWPFDDLRWREDHPYTVARADFLGMEEDEWDDE